MMQCDWAADRKGSQSHFLLANSEMHCETAEPAAKWRHVFGEKASIVLLCSSFTWNCSYIQFEPHQQSHPVEPWSSFLWLWHGADMETSDKISVSSTGLRILALGQKNERHFFLCHPIASEQRANSPSWWPARSAAAACQAPAAAERRTNPQQTASTSCLPQRCQSLAALENIRRRH